MNTQECPTPYHHQSTARHWSLRRLCASISFFLAAMTAAAPCAHAVVLADEQPSARAPIGRQDVLDAARARADQAPVPTEYWAIRLARGNEPGQVAAQLGAENRGRVGALADTYSFRIPGSRTDKLNGAMSARLRAMPQIVWFEQQFSRQQSKKLPADPLFANQWHLNNTGQSGGTSGQDANVIPVWDSGIFGTGVVIGVVDDGLQHTHPDLSSNYLASASYDFNDDDTNPAPNVAADFHGTSVAGVAAARDDGSACGAGVAYRASLAGLRLIAAPTTDSQEATALTYQYNNIHIYSNSWGPFDDAERLEAPLTLTQAALADGVANGRGGRGAIYVWAAGNGRQFNDNVNYDGYANSRYTIAVGAVDHNGVQAFYSEPGAPMLITAPSSGAGVGITTTDLLGANGYNTAAGSAGDCTNAFGGTSSSTPLVAGAIALMLETNPNLGWRDVQHILARTAVKNDATDADWTTNGAGHAINHRYGFGRVNAAAAVTAAQYRLRNLAATSTQDSGTIAVSQAIPDNNATGVTSNFSVGANEIVEHVEAVFNATHTWRGDLRVVLTSPAGTQSVLAETHIQDFNPNYSDWKFMSARHWGELSAGQWTLRVSDGLSGETGTFNSWRLVVYTRPLTFNDAPTTNFAWRWIEGLYNSGITSGCTASTYCPDDPVTRAQMAVFLERGVQGPTYAPPAATGAMFSDVGAADFAAAWIEQLATDGITSGCGGGNYCPNDSVTRAQMAVFLLRAKHGAGYTPPAATGAMFSDVGAADFAAAWIEQLATEGITSGCGGGNYCPNDSVTRAQMAVFLGRVFSLTLP